MTYHLEGKFHIPVTLRESYTEDEIKKSLLGIKEYSSYLSEIVKSRIFSVEEAIPIAQELYLALERVGLYWVSHFERGRFAEDLALQFLEERKKLRGLMQDKKKKIIFPEKEKITKSLEQEIEEVA